MTFIALLGPRNSAPLAAQEEADWRFGVVEAYTAPNSARELGIGWTRVRFQWADDQAGGPQTWTPAVSDDLIEAELAEGRLVVGLLIGVPEWARDEDGLPAGLWLDHDDPENSWGQFVSQVVDRYAGRIDHWVIWNEPDIAATAVAHTWDGTVDDFYQLQRVAYLAAKEANPRAVIHLSAFTYWADVYAEREQYMARLLDRIAADPQAADHNYYFDIATAHLYFQPDQIYTLLNLFQEIMNERGMSKPIWLMETNAPPHDDITWRVGEWTLSVTQGEQAAFMPQVLAAALAAGAQRIGVYKMQDTVEDRRANPEPFGLLRLDGSRRLAFISLRVAMENMSGITAVTRERWDEVGHFHFEQADRQTDLFFSRLPARHEVQVPAVGESALLMDMWGTERLIQAEDGVFSIKLPPALCTQSIGDYCMIGGESFYLVQANDGGPPPEGSPPVLPAPTITSTPSPTPTATQTPLASPTVLPTQTPPSTTTSSPTSPATQVPLPTLTAAATAVSQADSNDPVPTIMLEPAAGAPPTINIPILIIGGVGLVLIFLVVLREIRRR